MPSAPYYVYILECSDGSYYVGHTQDVENRLQEHINGEGALWTRNRSPFRLVYVEALATREEAVQREMQLKRWSRAKKEALIQGELERLRAWSKRKQK